jgi:predicted nucleic acid-binding protein
MSDAAVTVEEAVDNDVVWKAIRLDCASTFWPSPELIGVLGAARFVVRARVERKKLADAEPTVEERMVSFFRCVSVLEPTPDELDLAADVEREAQRRALPLDTGESQLAAMAATRGLALFTTGDKRAIESFEAMRPTASWLDALEGRVRCLEQLVVNVVAAEAVFPGLATRVCADADADKTLSICFGCLGGSSPSAADVVDCLASYISAVRETAPTLLSASS